MTPELKTNRRQFLRSAALSGGLLLSAGRTAGQEPTAIVDWHDLEAIRDKPGGEYVLAATLDGSTPGYVEQVLDREGGWQPINRFQGSFSGDGHDIVDLVVDRSEVAGLFKTNSGVIEKVSLVNCSVDSQAEAGSLVGQNSGSVRCASASGSVSGRRAVGGLVGVNTDAEGGGIVTESAARCTVSGQRNIGGLVGFSGPGTVITRSAAGGRVSGSNAVGGLVGRAIETTVGLSFASGSVTASAPGASGGLLGVAGASQETTETIIQRTFATGDVFGALVGGLVAGGAATISSSYATGGVAGQLSAGGLVGGGVTAIRDCYWDIESSGTTTGLGESDDSSVVGLETAAMQGRAARRQMDRFDFAGTWTTETDPPAYPTFQWRRGTCPTGRLTATEEASREANDSAVSDDSGSGFGIASGIAGFGVLTQFLRRRLCDSRNAQGDQ